MYVLILCCIKKVLPHDRSKNLGNDLIRGDFPGIVMVDFTDRPRDLHSPFLNPGKQLQIGGFTSLIGTQVNNPGHPATREGVNVHSGSGPGTWWNREGNLYIGTPFPIRVHCLFLRPLVTEEYRGTGKGDALLQGIDRDFREQLGDLAVMAFLPDSEYGLRGHGDNRNFLHRYLIQRVGKETYKGSAWPVNMLIRKPSPCVHEPEGSRPRSAGILPVHTIHEVHVSFTDIPAFLQGERNILSGAWLRLEEEDIRLCREYRCHDE
jgi:hypothetical protein